ncbi:Gfo/Idh/MocA family protein [Galbibacter mesophilus]|uniref:Gfo/Idh/MocA family protein n=1 Tax=Galbibacter mesophilus TaxID=379069 RepID=UPI00191F15CE|nr:Gfo/Idh/MocA family oxidoreductase [Galbibacter mesophilus]MCM5663372.1 Gfo/Idh/MocA family oxidoreductase [Galbibacter mesophilus]
MPLNKKNINWGILAPGHIAKKFAKDLLTIENAELYSVASRTLEKAEAFKNEYKGKVAYGSYEDLMKDPNVDAIYIANPHAFHKEYTIACLQHKKAVMCEKPLALNGEDVDLMLQTAKKENVLLMEALWTYFLPHYQFLLNFLKEGSFGKVTSMEADFGFQPVFDEKSRLFNKKLGGGSLLDIGIYPIFAALTILGKPEKIKASATFFETGADSSCKMLFEYPNNVKAELSSTLLEKTPTEAVIQCEKGTIKLHTQFHKPTKITFTDNNGNQTYKDFGVTTEGYSFETIHFNELLRENKKESPIMTHDFSRLLMQTMDKVKEQIGLQYS